MEIKRRETKEGAKKKFYSIMEFRSFILYFSSPPATKVMFMGQKNTLMYKRDFLFQAHMSILDFSHLFFTAIKRSILRRCHAKSSEIYVEYNMMCDGYSLSWLMPDN